MPETDSRPWIGLTAQMDPGKSRQYLSREYTDAVSAAGGIPLILPIPEDPGQSAAIVERLDGMFLTGNDSDLDPELYHAPRLEKCGPVQPLRDQMDFVLLERSLKRKIPVLAVCYGAQSLNVFLGGTLIQDIGTSVVESLRHSSSVFDTCPGHDVEISPGSVLEQIAGKHRITVNSTHHQAIDSPGKNLRVIARAPDGVAEAVFHESDDHWILGVQWHPEKNFTDDCVSRRLFEVFIARCRAVRSEE